MKTSQMVDLSEIMFLVPLTEMLQHIWPIMNTIRNGSCFTSIELMMATACRRFRSIQIGFFAPTRTLRDLRCHRRLGYSIHDIYLAIKWDFYCSLFIVNVDYLIIYQLQWMNECQSVSQSINQSLCHTSWGCQHDSADPESIFPVVSNFFDACSQIAAPGISQSSSFPFPLSPLGSRLRLAV